MNIKTECVHTLRKHWKTVNSVAFNHDGTKIVSCSGDKNIKIWNVESGECILTIEGHSSYVNSVAFNNDGTKIVSCSSDKSIKIWNAQSGECVNTFANNFFGLGNAHSDDVLSVAFNNDGTKIVSGSSDKNIKIWNVESGECLKTLEGHSSYVYAVAFNNDGTKIVSCSGDKSIKIWNVQSGECINTLEGHRFSVKSVAFNHDGTTIVSGSYDKSNNLKIWNVKSGECVNTLEGHSNKVNSVAFNNDGTKIVSGSRGASIKIWNVESGKCLNTLEGHSDYGSINSWVKSVAFNHDGTKIVSGAGNYQKGYQKGEIKIWKLSEVTYENVSDTNPPSTKICEERKSNTWKILPAKREEYLSQFKLLDTDHRGKIPGDTAQSFMMKSKLPIHVLGAIWDMSDVDKDGYLSKTEFCIVAHLIEKISCHGEKMPKTLPPDLFESASANTQNKEVYKKKQKIFESPPIKKASTSPQSDQVLGYARVIHSYQAETGKELSLIEDETIEVLKKDADWWMGMGTSGVGWFPSSYVEETNGNSTNESDIFKNIEHVAVMTWLESLSLTEYYENFTNDGYDDLETISSMEEDDLKDVG